MRTDRTVEKILSAFADAVEAGEYEAAEGWIAVADWVRSRSREPRPVPASR